MAVFVGKPLPRVEVLQVRDGEPPRKRARVGDDLKTPTGVQRRLIIAELVKAREQVLRYKRRVESLTTELEELPAEGEESDGVA